MVKRRGDQPLGLINGVLRGKDRTRAYDRVRHLREEVELAVSQGVVDQLALVLAGRRRHAGQVEDGNILCVGSADTANRAELPDTVRGAQSTDAAKAGVPVSGVSRVHLVAAPDPVNARVLDDGVLDRKGEIARDTEDVTYPDVLETSEHVLDYCLRHFQIPGDSARWCTGQEPSPRRASSHHPLRVNRVAPHSPG